jgi:hypothetical protein
MEIVNELQEWSSENVDVWRGFLATETGKRLLPKLVETAPTLLAGGELNSILIRSGEVRGFAQMVQALLNLASHPPVEQKSTTDNHPPLDDDAAWNDGQKLKD